ncbi:TPR-like protein [Colletotrichum sp. SAR 10_86]|nr:TPR-like protein [Colletotrichum sp. SAR 10_86]
MIAIESFTKFKETRSIDDLDEAINKATSALNAAQQPLEAPQEHQILPREDSILECLASALFQRYEETASLEDLNKGIERMWALVDPERTPDPPPGRFANLANALGKRYQRSNALQDLEKAIELLEMAVEVGPEDPLRPEWLNALGYWRGQRLQRKGEKKDFDEATKTIREAMRILPENHHLPEVLGKLGAWLAEGSREEDVNEAVELTGRALAATPEGDPRRADHLFKHSNALFSRFNLQLKDELEKIKQFDDVSILRRQDGSIMFNLNLHDLNSAIGFMAQAIGDFSSDYNKEAERMLKMGEMLRLRHACSAKVYAEERSEAFVAFSLVWDWRRYNATEFRCIRAAIMAAEILTEDARWEEASDLLQEAVEFLPSISPRSLSHADKQHMLSLSSKAAAAMLNANKVPWKALQILELGRGVIAGLLMGMRWDVSDLSKEWPRLADEFKFLCDEIDSLTVIPDSAMSSDVKSWGTNSRTRREADEKFGELLESIRSKSGFHDFLLPPTEQDLMFAH